MRKGFDIDPLLLALLRKMPPQSSLDGWPAEKRVRWFRAFAMNVSQLYDTEDEEVDLVIDHQDLLKRAVPGINPLSMTLEAWLVAFAERHDGKLSTYQVKPALIAAGLLKGKPRAISLQLYYALSGSSRFEKDGQRGRHRLVTISKEEKAT